MERNMLHLTIQDIAAEYAGYHTMPAFKAGVRDHDDFANHGDRRACSYSGVAEQAYDLGFEAAMRVRQHNK